LSDPTDFANDNQVGGRLFEYLPLSTKLLREKPIKKLSIMLAFSIKFSRYLKENLNGNHKPGKEIYYNFKVFAAKIEEGKP
jgi:hypothetical protein